MREVTKICSKQKKLLIQVAGLAGSIDVSEVAQRWVTDFFLKKNYL
jgi:hypothetical protein